MPTKSLFNRLSLSDLFAIIAPGFYIFIVSFIIFSVHLTTADTASRINLWSVLNELTSITYEKPSSLIFILFAAYLLGIILRSIPVRVTERLIPPFSSKFPYPLLLRDVLDTIKKKNKMTNVTSSLLPVITKDLPRYVFNYWKYLLCLRAPEGFQYYQSFEDRSRFFAGMIWASLVGTIVGIVMYFVTPAYNQVYVPLMVLSGIILLVFGSNFRRIRGQEARALFLIYVAYLQNAESASHQAEDQ